MTGRAYTSTMVGRGQLLLGISLGLLVAVIAVVAGTGWWLASAVFLLVAAVAVYLAVVRLSIGNGLVLIGQGPFARPARSFPAAAVVSASGRRVTWQESFGLLRPLARKTTRLTVRAGPALFCELDTGEYIRISTVDPEAAIAALGRPSTTTTKKAQSAQKEES